MVGICFVPRPTCSTISGRWTRLNPSDKYSRGMGKSESLERDERNFRIQGEVGGKRETVLEASGCWFWGIIAGLAFC